MALSYRKATIKLLFDATYSRPKAHEVERFIRDVIHIDPKELLGIHLSIVSSAVYLKFTDDEAVDRLLRRSTEGYRFCHSDGNVGVVTLERAGLGIQNVRVFELPFEVPADLVTLALQPYGTVLGHTAEKWKTFETYPVLNGVRQVRIELRRHIPSYLTIAGCRAIIIYDGQPRTCSGCGQEGHVRTDCMQRRLVQTPSDDRIRPSIVTSLPITYVAAARRETQALHDDPAMLVQASEAPAPVPEEPPASSCADASVATSSGPGDTHAPLHRQGDAAVEVEEQEDASTPCSAPDTEARQRKQKSPKRHKKRRKTAEPGDLPEEAMTDDEGRQPIPRSDNAGLNVPHGSMSSSAAGVTAHFGDARDHRSPVPGDTPTTTSASRDPVPLDSLGDWAQEMELQDALQIPEDTPMPLASSTMPTTDA